MAKKAAIKHGSFEIGLQTDDAGNPLVVVGGQIFGTVAEVRDLLDRYEARPNVRDASIGNLIVGSSALSAEIDRRIQQSLRVRRAGENRIG